MDPTAIFVVDATIVIILVLWGSDAGESGDPRSGGASNKAKWPPGWSTSSR